MKDVNLFDLALFLVGVALFVGFWGTVFYVIHHFIVKYW